MEPFGVRYAWIVILGCALLRASKDGPHTL
jgi:hypothetical protein